MSTKMVKLSDAGVAPLTEEEKDKFRAMARDALAPRAKLLAAGVEGINIADDIVKEMRFVILYYQPSNVLLKKGEMGNLIPECWSWDAITPDAASVDKKCETCPKCPNNAFGSADEGRGKKCKNSIRTFILLESKSMPILFSIPPTSFREFQVLLGKLLYHGIPYDRAVIKMTTKSTQKGAFPVTVAQFTIEGIFDGDVSVLDGLKSEVVPALNRRAEGASELVKEVEHETEGEPETIAGPEHDDIPA